MNILLSILHLQDGPRTSYLLHPCKLIRLALCLMLLSAAGLCQAQAVCEVERGTGHQSIGPGSLPAPLILTSRPDASPRIRTAARHRRATITQGLGYAYRHDPADGAYDTVALPRLYGDGTRLNGVYARVSSARINPDGAPTPSLDGNLDYRYLPTPTDTPGQACLLQLQDCSLFDAVNLYYHLDTFAHTYWVERLGLDLDFQVEAVTHISGDGGFADGERLLLKLGLGDLFMKNAALADDIIYHEYTHLVTTELGFVVGTTSPVETRALNEGYADYFTTSFTDDPRFGEWVVTCPPRQGCEGPPNDRDLRTLATDSAVWNWQDGAPPTGLAYGVCTRYHEADRKCKTSYNNFADQYVWGIIWGSALWDLRAALGADTADRLILAGLLDAHPSDLTFAAALDALFSAEARLYAGQHATTLETVFGARGIYPSATSITRTHEEAPPAFTLHPNVPNPFSTTTEIRFTLPEATPLSLVVYDVLGRTVAQLADGWYGPGTHRVTWQPGALPAGLYVCRLTAGPRMQTLRLLRL